MNYGQMSIATKPNTIRETQPTPSFEIGATVRIRLAGGRHKTGTWTADGEVDGRPIPTAPGTTISLLDRPQTLLR